MEMEGYKRELEEVCEIGRHARGLDRRVAEIGVVLVVD